MQFLLCAHVKAVCILHEFSSKECQVQQVSGGCIAELWAGSGQGCPVPVQSWLLPAAQPSALPNVAWPSSPGLAGGWDVWGERVSCALLRLTVQLHPQNKTSLSCTSEQPKG